MKKVLQLMFLLIFTSLIMVGCGNKKIDLSSFAKIEVKGYNGKATADLKIDWSGLEKEILSVNESDSLGAFTTMIEIEDSIEYSINKEENISNGDKIVLSVNWDNNVAKKYKVKFHSSNLSIQVKDLQELKEIDLFTDIHVEYEGISPTASVIIRNTSNDPFIKSINFSTEPYLKVANGDQILVKADITAENAEQKGYLVKSFEKTYPATGIDEYINKYNMIDKETLDKMQTQAKNLIETDLAGKYEFVRLLYPDSLPMYAEHDSVKVNSTTLKHAYFFTIKPGVELSYGDIHNSIFLVYELKFTTNLSKNGAEETVYIPVYYSDIIKRNDGKTDVVITDGRITSAKSNTFDNLYRDVVSANKAKYDYEEINY